MSIAHNQLRIARDLWARLQPLDRAAPARLQTLLGDRRFGSRDRRLYRELLFTAMRLARLLARVDPADEATWSAHLAAHCAITRETEAFRTTYARPDLLHPASPLDLLPSWFSTEHDPDLPAPPTEVAAALIARAPVWVRLQTEQPDEAFAEWAARGWAPRAHPALPGALQLPPETSLSACASYQAGHYEIQDLGSQLILASLDLPARSPGPRWLDACAGAGGKSLQLACLLGSEARIDASDIRPAALAELRARAARAGLGGRIRTLSRPGPDARYDGVLVDAPCSGSGTWRRSPHLMSCTSETDLAAAARTQKQILREVAPLVRPGGLLVYATCSIARTENRAVAEAFLEEQSGKFVAEPIAHDHGFPRLGTGGLAIHPGREDNDGFFVATFRRTADY
jgi:16S rRNA (cytosine967-C5)-methyltransferase